MALSVAGADQDIVSQCKTCTSLRRFDPSHLKQGQRLLSVLRGGAQGSVATRTLLYPPNMKSREAPATAEEWLARGAGGVPFVGTSWEEPSSESKRA